MLLQNTLSRQLLIFLLVGGALTASTLEAGRTTAGKPSHPTTTQSGKVGHIWQQHGGGTKSSVNGRATPRGQGWQLVAIDDALVAKRSPSVIRQYHSMVKHKANPVMQASLPWEHPNVYVYGSVWPSHDRSGTLQMCVDSRH
jgi:hypothetical protein